MPSDLDALDALVRRMTPGPWEARHIERSDETGEVYGWDEIGSPEGLVLAGSEDRDVADARAIAALRNVGEELIAVARAAAPWQAGERCCPSTEAAASRGRGPCAPCVLAYALDALDARLRGEREVERG